MQKSDIFLFYKIEYKPILDKITYKDMIFLNKDKIYTIICKDTSIFKLGKIENNMFYEWISYNKFKQIPENLPDLKQIIIPQKLSTKYLCGNNKNITEKVEAIKNNEYYIFGKASNYLISINNKNVYIFKKYDDSIIENNIIKFYFLNYLNTLRFHIEICSFIPEQIFIKKCVNNYDIYDYFNENVMYILLHISGNKYLYINNIFCYEFISYDLITTFELKINKHIFDECSEDSEDNEDSEDSEDSEDNENNYYNYYNMFRKKYYYTYAIDKLNNYYSLDENIIMIKNNGMFDELDKLYNLKYVIINGFNNDTFIKNFQQIDKFYENNMKTSLLLDFDYKIYDILSKPLSIFKIDGTKEILNRTKYMKLMKDYGNEVGIHKFKCKIIYK